MTDKICIGLIGAITGIFFTWYFYALDDAYYFKISVQQTRQNIISFPNGTVFKKITEANEVLNDR